MAVIIKLTGPYYREFHKRKDSIFSNQEAIEVYKATQKLQQSWPNCLNNKQVTPDVVKKGSLYYMRFNFAPPQQIKFRIGFGVRTLLNSNIEIVALTCKTKQELSSGGKSGTDAWEKHLSTIGKTRWFDYRKGFITSCRIY